MKPVYKYGVALFVVIVIVAMRFSNLGLIEFKEDESRAIKLAYENLHNSPASGGLLSSAGIYNPPFFVYLMSIPVVFTSNPAFVTSFVIIINILALFILYYAIKRYFSAKTAVITSLLFASSPWVFLYSRKIWAQDCVFPFLILFYALLFSNIERYGRGKVFMLFLLLSAITQLHMSAWFLLPPLLIFMVIFKVRIKLFDLIGGLFLFILSYAPYIYFNVIHGFQKPPSAHRVDIYGNLAWSFIIHGAAKFDYYLGNGFDLFLAEYHMAIPQIFFNFYLVVMAAGLVFVVFVLAKQFKGYYSSGTMEIRYKMLALFMLIYAFVQASLILFRVGGYPHYNIVCYPVLAVFAGYFIDHYREKMGPAVKTLISAIIACVILSNLYFTAAFFDFIGHQPEYINGHYGTPYRLQGKLPEASVKSVVTVNKK